MLRQVSVEGASRLSGSAGWVMAGSATENVEPSCGALSTRTPPRWPRTIPWTTARPRPRPVNLVV